MNKQYPRKLTWLERTNRKLANDDVLIILTLGILFYAGFQLILGIAYKLAGVI